MTSLATGSVVLDPVQIAVNRTALNLNSGPIGVGGAPGTGIDWGQALITPYEAELQRFGSSVVDFRLPNRMVTIPLMLGLGGGSYQTALTQLREKVGLLQREGGWVGRSSSTGRNLYADVVNASLTIPDVYGEIGSLEPGVSLILECLPDFYGDIVSLDAINATDVAQTVLQQAGVQAVIAGDYPGRATITVTDASGNPQYGLLWGFRSQNYSPSATAALTYSTLAGLSGAGGGGVSGLAGAHGGLAFTSNVIGSSFSAICGDGSLLTHVGAYQMWARCYTTSPGMSAQMGWARGDVAHGLVYGPQVPIPGTGAFYLLNLGQVNVQTPPVGNAGWAFQLGAVGPGSGQNFSYDQVYLMPLDESAGFLQGTVANTDFVVPASSPLQLSHKGAWRLGVFAGYYSPVGLTFGDLPRIPPSGMEGRAVQLLMKPSRGDLQSTPDSSITDSFTIQVAYRPAYSGAGIS